MTLMAAGTSLMNIWSNDGTPLGIIEDTAENLAAFIACCCPGGPCTCANLSASIDVRIKWACVAPAGQGSNQDYPAALTEQVGNPPGTQPGCPGPIQRYYSGLLSVPCANPNSITVDFVCCGASGGLLTIFIRYTPTGKAAQPWISPDFLADDPCCKWTDRDPPFEFNDTGANCGNCSPFSTPSIPRFMFKCTGSSWTAADDAF